MYLAFAHILVSLLLQLSAADFPKSRFNAPPGVDIWCGKAYRAANASFNPGGQLDKSSRPSLIVAPRYSIYLEDENSGSFLIDTNSSNHERREPVASSEQLFKRQSKKSKYGSSGKSNGSDLTIHFSVDGKSLKIMGKRTIATGEVSEVEVSFKDVPARTKPYKVALYAETKDGQKLSASTELIRLPLKDKGSAVRIDNRHGGLDVRQFTKSNSKWEPYFPLSYYVQWDRYFNKSVSTLESFSKQGYNLIHIVPTGSLGGTPFPWNEFEPYLDKALELGLYFQYDVLYLEKGLDEGLEEQVKRLRDHPSILLWYIADEPDGKSVALDHLPKGYDRIRDLDLYHPVSMALNCEDFHYKEYASAADIIMSDVYPISTNTMHSNQYDTPCNATYGCCGCDNCKGALEDVSDRLDRVAKFDEAIGWQKVHWNVPQAFGNESFWERFPSAAEVVAMTALGINHNAKGSVMWNYPTSDEIAHITVRLANVLTEERLVHAVLKGSRHGQLDVNGAERIDASVWIAGDSALAIIVNLNHGDVDDVAIELPSAVRANSVSKTLWGDAQWKLHGGKLKASKFKGLETSIIWLKG